MIGGIYHDKSSLMPSPVECTPAFYLKNRKLFNESIGVDFENRLGKYRHFTGESIILGTFCELIGPMSVLVIPENCILTPDVIDALVLQSMSSDYQACEQGDFVFNTTTQNLNADGQMSYIVHYFTLWDIFARGYVRPCCIIMCTSDKIRARSLFDDFTRLAKETMEPFMKKNMHHFYVELQQNLRVVIKMISLCDCGELETSGQVSMDQLKHMANEYTHLIVKITETYPDKNIDIEADLTDDIVIDTNFTIPCGKRQPRSLYSIFNSSEDDVYMALESMLKNVSIKETAGLFVLNTCSALHVSMGNTHALRPCDSLLNMPRVRSRTRTPSLMDSLLSRSPSMDPNSGGGGVAETAFGSHLESFINDSSRLVGTSPLQIERLRLCGLAHFQTAIGNDRTSFVKSSGSSCVCEQKRLSCLKELSQTVKGLTGETSAWSTCLFPGLVLLQSSQAQFVSQVCKRLSTSVSVSTGSSGSHHHQQSGGLVVRLLACLLGQGHLIVLVDPNSSYLGIMRFLKLFLPKPHPTHFLGMKTEWPTITQIHETPVTFLRKDFSKMSVPVHLEKIVAIYDDTTMEYHNGPKYEKGFITDFMDSFKALEYDHNHLDILINIMVLGYVDVVYQWLALLNKRDRRRICEYLASLGLSADDVRIGERLALYVLQSLLVATQTSYPGGEAMADNTMLTAPCLYFAGSHSLKTVCRPRPE